jgi:transcription initiation factor TFIIF subunit beta
MAPAHSRSRAAAFLHSCSNICLLSTAKLAPHNKTTMTDSMADIKPAIKVDPADEAGRSMADMDEFEEDIDLAMPRPEEQAWLLSVPNDVWQAWYDMYQRAPENEVIEIGKLRVFHAAEAEDPLKQKIELRLHRDAAKLPEHDKVLKNYDVTLTANGDGNVSVFSEKDLPGHRSAGRNRQLQANRPSGIPSKSERYGKDGRVNYRTAIPKQTALAPRIHHEAKATPIEDAEYHAHLKRAWDAHLAPKSRATYIEGIDRTMHPGRSALTNLNPTFSLSSRPGAKGQKTGKVVKDKAVRVEGSVLLKRLEDCFRRYKYWGMRALRNELKQPEAWIKENLEQIATLVRSGDFANNWQLKPEFANIIGSGDDVKEEAANIESGTDMASGDEMDDDDDDPADFQDVNMEGGS